MKKGADSRVSREKLVVSTGQRLSDTAQGFSPKARARGGPVLALWPNMSRGPLGRGPRPCLRGHPGEVRKAGFPPKLVRDSVMLAGGRLLGVMVCHLVAHNADMGRSPEDGSLVLSAQEAREVVRVCVALYPLTRCLRGQQRFIHNPFPSQLTRVKPGHPNLLLPRTRPARQGKEENVTKERQRKKDPVQLPVQNAKTANRGRPRAALITL